MRKLLVIGTLAMLAAFALATRPGADTSVVYAATPQVFGVGAADQPYNIPAGTTRLLIEARGGKGGQPGNPTGIASCLAGALGGVGNQVTTIYTVPLGTTQLFVNVGGNGAVTAGGANGGGNGGTTNTATLRGAGGGGGSDVRLAAADPATRVVVAGGGGGGGGCGDFNGTFGGTGGPAGLSGGTAGPAGQGGGGGLSAIGATPGPAGPHFGSGTPPTAGTAAGIGGNGGNGNIINVTTQNGGGGGGGGGYAAGGGGGAGNPGASGGGGGGGGGGSSFAGAGTAFTITVPHPDGQASVGRVTITPIDPLTVTKSFNPAAIQVNATSIVGLVITNGNAFPLTGITFTDNLPGGVTVNGAATTFGGNPACTVGGGVVSTTATSITLTNGVLGAGATCAIGVPVTSATVGTYVNPSFTVTTTEGVTTNSNAATLVVTALPVTPSPTPVTPTLTPVPFVPPVIPQVFQQVPLGIFTNPHPNTPTPVLRVAVAPVVVDPGVMPILRPPSTGDAGLRPALGRLAADSIPQ